MFFGEMVGEFCCRGRQRTKYLPFLKPRKEAKKFRGSVTPPVCGARNFLTSHKLGEYFDYGTRFYLVAFFLRRIVCTFLSAKKGAQRRHKGRGSSDSPPPLDPTLLKRPRVFPSRTLPGITESYSFSNTGILYRLRGVAVCLPQGRSVELYFHKTVFVNRKSEPHGIYPTESVNLRREMAQEICRPYGTSFPDSPEGVRGRKSLGRFNRVGFWGGEESELPLPKRLLCSTFFAERKLKTISSKRTRQDKNLCYGQNTPKLPQGKNFNHPNGAFLYYGTSPPLQSLFTSRRLCSPYYRPRHKTVRIFSAKEIRSPRRFRKERHFLLCYCVISKKLPGDF